MVATYGIAKISEGTDYEEHDGEQISLLFGDRIAYVKSNAQAITAGMQSEFGLGKANQVGSETRVSIHQVDDIHYAKGMAAQIAQTGGGAYEQSFSVTAGTSDANIFGDLSSYLNDAIFTKVSSLSSSFTEVKSVITDTTGAIHLNKDGKLGVETAADLGSDLASVVDEITKTALPKLISTYQDMNPYAVLTINEESAAFLGTRGGNGKNGSTGLLMSPTGFTLSADPSNRAFTKTSDYVSGYSGDATVSMQATTSNATLDVAAAVINIKASKSGSQESTSAHTASQYSVKTTNGSESSSMVMSASEVELETTGGIGSSSVSVQSSQVKGKVGSSTSFTLSTSSGTLEYVSAASKVVVSSSSAKLSYGSSSVSVDVAGVSINGSSLKVLP